MWYFDGLVYLHWEREYGLQCVIVHANLLYCCFFPTIQYRYRVWLQSLATIDIFATILYKKIKRTLQILYVLFFHIAYLCSVYSVRTLYIVQCKYTRHKRKYMLGNTCGGSGGFGDKFFKYSLSFCLRCVMDSCNKLNYLGKLTTYF